MSSTYYYRYLASSTLFRVLAGPKRKGSRKPKKRILNYEIYTRVKYLIFGHIILCLLMNPVAIHGSDIGELAGHRSA